MMSNALTNQSGVHQCQSDTRRRYGLPFYHPHHALTDALACAELLQAQLITHYGAKTPVGKLWL